MRFSSTLVVVLPALALAQEQVPLADKIKGWINRAQSYISSAVPSVPSPMDAGAAKVAEHVEHVLTLDNWKSVLVANPSSTAAGPEDWMIYITGGNKTCYGVCGNATKAWNVRITRVRPLFSRFHITDTCYRSPSPFCQHLQLRPTSPSLTARTNRYSATPGLPDRLPSITCLSLVLSPISQALHLLFATFPSTVPPLLPRTLWHLALRRHIRRLSLIRVFGTRSMVSWLSIT